MFTKLYKQVYRVGFSVGSLAARIRKEKKEACKPSPLNFLVGKESVDEVIEARGQWILGRKGRALFYLLDGSTSEGERMAAETAKAKCISRILENTENPQTAMHAKDIAAPFLQGAERGEFLSYIVAHDVAGNGPISMLMENPEVEEIVVNSPEAEIGIYHARYGFCRTNLRFANEQAFRFTINRLVKSTEKELSSAYPIIDAQMEDGARVHAQIRPHAVNGAAASIRLRGDRRKDIRELMSGKAVDAATAAYLWMAIETGHNIVITGAPSSGKTTLLNALMDFAPKYHRIIAIEDEASELRFGEGMPNAVSLLSTAKGASLKDQVVNALHMRPDRLIVGELRGEEAREVFFGANVGVPFMTTIHTKGDGSAVTNRLGSKPMSVEPEALCMLDIAVLMDAAGGRRRIGGISEYRWACRGEMEMEEGNPLSVTQISKEGIADMKSAAGSKVVASYADSRLISPAAAIRELRKREGYLQGMAGENGMSSGEYICRYQT